MTNGTLDGISLAIGGLQADMKNVMSAQERMFTYIKNSNDAVLTQLQKHIEDDNKKHNTNDTDIEELKQFRNRIYTIAAVVSFGVTTFAQFLVTPIKKLFS
jgi:hypothetical protein